MVKDCLHAEGEDSTSPPSDLFGPHSVCLTQKLLTRERCSQPARRSGIVLLKPLYQADQKVMEAKKQAF